MAHYSRRKFLEFLGHSSAGAAFASIPIISCNSSNTSQKVSTIKGIAHSDLDDIVLADGLNYKRLVTFGDHINSKDTFGFNNDYIAFLPETHNKGLLWVNHEYVHPMFIHGVENMNERTKEHIIEEQYNVGGSFVQIERKQNQWQLSRNQSKNARITSQTKIPFNWHEKINGSDHAVGTLANCSGGITPWGTILTCEENYDAYYGEIVTKNGTRQLLPGYLGWEKYFDFPPEHYGWVVEVDPQTLRCKKHIALGRCAHECATVQQLPNERIVVYSGDDANNECIYKFIADEPNSLEIGTLYVANLEKGLWVAVDYNSQPILQQHFANQTEVLIYLRKAAKLLGGTPLDRPEDIEIDPLTGAVFIALTNNIKKGNYHGSILKITENNNDHSSLNFSHEIFLAGGVATGFACPDNMAFDRKGNLWFTSDISGELQRTPEYKAFKNNGLFYVARSGTNAGKVIQIASAPVDAEFTGPYFSPDYTTLFLSVQHPGETSKSLNDLSSHWPDGGDTVPRPAVIAIQGELMERLVMATF